MVLQPSKWRRSGSEGKRKQGEGLRGERGNSSRDVMYEHQTQGSVYWAINSPPTE